MCITLVKGFCYPRRQYKSDVSLCWRCLNYLYQHMVEVDGFEPPRSLGTQDLQSRAIDRYAIPPDLATRDGIEPPLEVLETSALPLY